MNIKEVLFKQCVLIVNNRMGTVEEIISSNQKALQSETKSSAGDKHETGRAMLQLEIEKASQQLKGINQMKITLAKIDVFKQHKIAHLGSIIETNHGNYFLSISAGKLTIYDKNYFAVSTFSPIGKRLLGKKTGEQFTFNGSTTKIVTIT
ncbi:MAG: 3-oxoacyl-ACP synthase [Polaribacter sp.]|nr:3-oxoacyl-ACP synthase [Polaribacter sp.]MDG2357173.1 3-oxoacyl-ACP synthase [Polaribacter sp.]